MNIPSVNLYYLYISVPLSFEKGLPIAYTEKSIGSILDDKNTFELIILGEWIQDQFMDSIGWNLDKEITVEMVAKALEHFVNLGIKPTKCTYVDPTFIKGDINDNNK